MDKIYVQIVFLFLFVECFLVNKSDACSPWVEGFDTGGSCVIDHICNDWDMIVLFRATDYPLAADTSKAYCFVNGTLNQKKYFEEDSSGNWTTNAIDYDTIEMSFDSSNNLHYKTHCYIQYGGENVEHVSDKNFTIDCSLETVSVAVEFTVQDTSGNNTSLGATDIGIFSGVSSTDPKAQLSICGKNDTQKDCALDKEVTVGEKVCLAFWTDDEVADIQIVKMTFSSGANKANKLAVYENCVRSQDALIDTLFEPEPDYSDNCNYTGVENCPKLRTQCFSVFRFKDSFSMNFELVLRMSSEKNVKESCNSRRKRDVNDENVKDIIMTFNLEFGDDSKVDINENFLEEIKSPLTQEMFIVILVASGLFVTLVALLLYIIKCRTAKIAGIDNPKVVA